MSFFLQQEDMWPQGSYFHKTRTKRLEISVSSHKHINNLIQKNVRALRNKSRLIISRNSGSKTHAVLFPQISKIFKGLLVVTYQQKDRSILVSFKILDNNENLYKFASKPVLFQFFRKLFLSQQTQFLSVKIVLNQNNLHFSADFSYFSIANLNLVQDLQNNFVGVSKNLVSEIFKNHFLPLIPFIEKELYAIIPLQNRIEEKPSEHINSLNRYCKMMTLKAYLGSDTAMTSEETRKKQINQRKKNTLKLIESNVTVGNDMIRPSEFYRMIKPEFYQKRGLIKQFQIEEKEKKIMQQIDMHDDEEQIENGLENHTNILNHVYLQNPDKLKSNKINEGGFSTIEKSLINFRFFDEQSQKNVSDIPENRNVAIKKGISQQRKNLHQYNILREIKNGFSPLFLRYYIPVNYPNNNYQKQPVIMMDYANGKDLSTFLNQRNQTMSLNTKIYILYSITMSLRFLETYKIVHLDLKPQNIIVTPGLNIKLIDFGQAYHPQVCKAQGKYYRPGFTKPYTPPQVKLGMKSGFKSKADVYSLGVIIYQVLYNRLPQFKNEYLNVAPELLDEQNNPVIMRILNWLISRCLGRHPDFRPQLDWIAIILRIILEIIE